MKKFKRDARDIENMMVVAEPLDMLPSVMRSVLSIYKLLPAKQLLALSIAFLICVDKYQVEANYVLSEAHRILFSGEFGNMTAIFKDVQKKLLKEESEA